MIIRINDERLDFKIEKEQSLRDVLDGIESWVGGEGGVIQRMLVEGEDMPLSHEEWDPGRDLESVGEIDIYAASTQRHAAATLSTLGDYVFMMLDRWLGPESHSSYDDVMSALGTVIDAVRESSSVLGVRVGLVLGGEKRYLDAVLKDLDGLKKQYERRYYDEDGRMAIVSALKEVVDYVPKLLKWAVIKNPAVFDEVEKGKKQEYFQEVRSDFLTILRDTEGLFEAIAENLQTGNDGEAMDAIYRMTEILDECIELLKITGESDKFQEDGSQAAQTFRDITSRLHEVYGALSQGDMVTVGDVMEYEIYPLWKSIAGFFPGEVDFAR